ncbi:MAG: hypothetical protein O8C62_05225 [Candidatus Methanoperedens sp.]|nr:hypothetical protein [Candidatus Methanoperedens sp.]
MNNNQRNRILNVGGLQIKSMDDIFTSDIKSPEDFKKLNKKIERWISYYRLDSLLLIIHDFFLSDVGKKYPPFIPANITKYAILNSNMHSGWSPMWDDDLIPIMKMVADCSVYDPDFNLSNKSLEEKEEIVISFFLRKIGSQSRLYPQIRLGGTIYLYEEMAKDKNAPPFIKELVNSQFEKLFGVSIFDFLKIGFFLFLRSSNSANKGGLTGEDFENARKQGISIPNNEVVNNCLKQIACDQYQFREICIKNKSKEDYYKSYEMNPLLKYPIIRIWNPSHQNNPKDDKFIAPVPNLLVYRLTTGLYYQLFNMNEGEKEKFSQEFGKLFELYTGVLLGWYKLPDKILSADEIEKHIPGYEKKHIKKHIKIPDWMIFCEEGVILIECKATRYSQDMYERGLKAEANSCFNQIGKAIIQMNKFETQIPRLCEKFGKNYTDVKVQKIIVSHENLIGFRGGPLKNYVDRKILKNGYSKEWKTLWIGELEEIQPYITGGANFWSFLIDIENKDLDVILKEMKSKTNASDSDGYLYKYQNKLFSELLKNIGKTFRTSS